MGSGWSRPYFPRIVRTIASLASGPAASRAGSPGTTCEIANVTQRSPNSIRPRNRSRLRAYCFRALSALLGDDRQWVEVHLAREPDRAEDEPLHVVPHAPPPVGEHPEDLRRVGCDLLLDLGVERRALLPPGGRARPLDQRPDAVVRVERGAVVLAPGVLMVLICDRVGVGRDRRGEHRHHIRRGVRLRAARHHVGPRERDHLHLEAELGQVVDERSEEHTSELQSLAYLVCRLLLEKKKTLGPSPCRSARGAAPSRSRRRREARSSRPPRPPRR